MPALAAYTKDPDAILDYSNDWSSWLVTGDTIASSQWLPASGITIDNDSLTTTLTTVWLSGGTTGSRYSLTNRITTAQGRTDDRTIVIVVRQR